MTVEEAIDQTMQWLDWNFDVSDAYKFEGKLEKLQMIYDPVIAEMTETS